MTKRVKYKPYFAGSRLRELRLARKLTQKRLADAVGCSRPAISELERSHNDPSFHLLVSLARYFNKPTDHFIR